jgi:RNA polymerase sigma-70 factor, ECF subfamily
MRIGSMVKALRKSSHLRRPGSTSLELINPSSPEDGKDTEGTSALPYGKTGRSGQTSLEEEVLDLYSLWAGNLLRYARTLSADLQISQDALQETFLRYFLNRSEGRLILNPKAWLFKVLRNFLLDYQKDAYQKNKVDLERASLHPDRRPNQQVDLENQEIFLQVIAQLSLRELECIRLRIEGFDYSEIAELMGIRKGTVGALIARAIQKIQKER